MYLQVIVPCYNPPEHWETLLAAHFAAFQAMISDKRHEVGLMVVNDGSTQNTTEANIKRLSDLIPGVQMVSYTQNMGKGFALRKGVSASEAEFIILTDADFPYTLASMIALLEILEKKGGLVAGQRDTSYYQKVPFFRRILSTAFRWILRRALLLPMDDSQCGLKGFDQKGKAVFLRTTIRRFLFDLEFLMLANNNVSITPMPVELRDGVQFNAIGWEVLVVELANLIQILFRNPKNSAKPPK